MKQLVLHAYDVLDNGYATIEENCVRLIVRDTDGRVPVYIEITPKDDGLEIRGSGPLCVIPEVSNVIRVKLRIP